MVPSGSPVLDAISVWVSPWKKAISSTARCATGISPRAPRIFPRARARSVSEARSGSTETTTSSIFASGRRLRRASMERLRVMTDSHAGRLPRLESNNAGLRHNCTLLSEEPVPAVAFSYSEMPRMPRTSSTRLSASRRARSAEPSTPPPAPMRAPKSKSNSGRPSTLEAMRLVRSLPTPGKPTSSNPLCGVTPKDRAAGENVQAA